MLSDFVEKIKKNEFSCKVMNRAKVGKARLREVSPYSAPIPSANLALKSNQEVDKRKSKVPEQAAGQAKQATLTAQMKKLNPVQVLYIILETTWLTVLVQLVAFQKIFESFDLEKSGTLTAEELHKCINQLAG